MQFAILHLAVDSEKFEVVGTLHRLACLFGEILQPVAASPDARSALQIRPFLPQAVAESLATSMPGTSGRIFHWLRGGDSSAQDALFQCRQKGQVIGA
jgi:hypothetical protein